MANYTEKVSLPSRGLLGGVSEVVIRTMTTAEEKLLLGSSSDILDTILKECIVSPVDIKLDDLISSDKHFLLMKIRIISYGNEYHVSAKCPACGGNSEYKIDLDSLTINSLEDGFTEPYDEFELPQCKKTITLKLPRTKDLNDADTKAKRFHKKFVEAKGDMSYIYRLMINIDTVDGEVLNFNQLQEFIESLCGKDSSYLRNRISKIKIGYDIEMVEECSNARCGEDVKFSLPLTYDFFRTRFDD